MSVRSVGRSVVLSVAAVLAAAAGLAQETRGRITGRVVDSSTAPIPGASVAVTDTARGTTVTSTTSNDGLFQANYLLPGTYEVSVTMQSFKKFVQSNVRVQLNETVNLTIPLEVGGVEETVSVTAEVQGVNTSDANMGLTMDSKRLAELPLIHGDPYKLMGLASGVAHSGSQRLDRPYEPTHIVGYAYGGTRGNRSDLLIDGLPSTSTANANEVIASYVPPSDMVQEFKVQTATFDAQFGNTEGGVTSIGIKAGTNAFHGSAYYFFEPVELAANDYFGNLRGQDRIDSSSTRPGFHLTGPIRKDSTFFSVGYERIKDVRPRFDAGASVWVPTEAMRNGDLSAFIGQVQIYDPLTRVPSGSNFVGQPFPNNIIPADRISPVARAILDFYSLPRTSGPLNGNIFDSTLAETAEYDSITVRLDQKVSDSNRMFVRGSYYGRDSNYNEYFGGTPADGTLFQFISYQAMIDDVHTFNPTTVLNVRYGWNRFERNSGQQPDAASDFDLTRLGFPAAYNDLVPAADRGFPRLNFPGGTMVGVAYGGDFRPTTSHTVASTLTKVFSSHSLKVGGEMRIYREDSKPTGNARSGNYTFDNAYTRPSSANSADVNGIQAFAAFLLGLPSTTQIDRASDYSEYSRTWGFFIQDDWRVNSKLTVNLGVRYEVETPLTERNNKSVSGFDFGFVQPFSGTANARYAALNDPALKALVPSLNATGGLQFAGVDGGSRLYNAPKDTLMPRLGFVYQINSKTVIRGGGGLFAGFLGQRRGDVFPNGFAQTTTIGLTQNSFGAPIPRDIQNALLTQPILEPVGASNGRLQSIGNNITFFNQNPEVSKNLRWQLGFQRELPGGFTFEAAYVGNRGWDIEINQDINALPTQYLNGDGSRTAAMNQNNSFLSGSVANPFQGLLPGSGNNNSTIARRQLLRPYPSWGSLTTTNNDGKSWYDSAQLSLQKRFSQGYTLGVSYTYSKWEQATEYLNAGDTEPTRVVSDLDVPHRLSISGIIELPFGKGRPLLSNAGGLAQALLGGWQLQGVYTYQSGFPITFGNPANFSGDLFYNGQPIAVSNPTRERWFNTDAFTSVLTGPANNATPADHRRTLPWRFDDVRRDSINNVDLSLIKDVKLKNEVKLQLRAEFVNAFNSPYFPAPVVNPTSTSFGQVSASNQENYARRAQLGVKLVF